MNTRNDPSERDAIDLKKKPNSTSKDDEPQGTFSLSPRGVRTGV
jgi:hypothetical protein